MKITYIAKRHRDGLFHCYDVIADGIYLNLFLSEGARMEKIAQHAGHYLENPFPESRMNDSITAIMGSLDAVSQDDAIPVFPEGKPSMQWNAVEMQNYLTAFSVKYSDGDTKKVMLERIKEHYIKEPK